MKAYIYVGYSFGCDGDNCVHVVHAESRNQARQLISGETGQEYMDVTVRRCPSMDDLPATDFYLLAQGLVAWYECVGCYRKIYSDGNPREDQTHFPAHWECSPKDWSPYAYLDDADDGTPAPAIKGEIAPESDVISRPVHAEGVGVFCSEDCYAKWYGGKEWHAIRKLRGLDGDGT